MAGTGRMGRPSKGPRDDLRIRVPKPLRAAIDAAAAREGKTLNDWIGELAAEKTGVPYHPTKGEALPQSA